MEFMFYGYEKLNCNLSNWDCPKYANHTSMFKNTPILTKRTRHPKWK